MARPRRSKDVGFPRWRGYGSAREAEQVRLCDRHGCDSPGTCPAPKSPNSPERWYFCAEHAAEYNKNWDYFQGLNAEEAAKREADGRRDAGGVRDRGFYGWSGAGERKSVGAGRSGEVSVELGGGRWITKNKKQTKRN